MKHPSKELCGMCDEIKSCICLEIKPAIKPEHNIERRYIYICKDCIEELRKRFK